MPRIRQYQEKYAREDILREIRTKQGAYNLMHTKALAGASGIPYCTLRRRLENPDDFTVAELRKLNLVLNLDCEKLLIFMGCSKKQFAEKGGTERGSRIHLLGEC